MQSFYVFDKGGVFQCVFSSQIRRLLTFFNIMDGFVGPLSMAGSPATNNVIWFVTESMVSLIGTFECRYSFSHL